MDIGVKGMRRASQPPGGATSVAFLMGGGDCPLTPEKNSVRVQGNGSGGLGRPYSVLGTVSPAGTDQAFRRSSSRTPTPSRNPITGEILTPSTGGSTVARPYSIAGEKAEVPPLDLDLASITIEEAEAEKNDVFSENGEEEVVAEEAGEDEGAPPAPEEEEAEPKPKESQQSSLESWQDAVLTSAVSEMTESKMAPENLKDISATCQARLSEDLARGSLVESDRLRSASSKPMSARAEARAGGTPSTPVLRAQPLGYQMKSLHESSLKMKVQSSVEFMNQKIRFSARSVNPAASRESLRTLCGYFFPSDGSMTIYEFKQLKRANVCQHFIERNVHWHVKGPRKGNAYSIGDISVGENLTFLPCDHPTLPEALGKDPSLTVRITAVDFEAKKKALTAMKDGVAPSNAELTLPDIPEEEAEQRIFLQGVQESICSQLSGRAIRTLVGVLSLLIKSDSAANADLTSHVTKSDFISSLKEYKISLDQEELDKIFEAIDEMEDDAVNYLHVLDALTGGMNEARTSFVRRAFDKVDMEKGGIVNFMNLKKFANPKLSDEMELFKVYDNKVLQGGIAYAQFSVFYLGLSLETSDDDEFIRSVKDQWCLLGC